MRMVLIAAALVVLPVAGHAQSRPAPDTPGEAEVLESHQTGQVLHMTDALRMMAVTVGIIGGFVAADIVSGGALTAPLLSGADAAASAATAAGGRRAVAPALGLRPVIAPPVPGQTVAADLPALRRTLGQALAPRP